jgi:hypothetical protein
MRCQTLFLLGTPPPTHGDRSFNKQLALEVIFGSVEGEPMQLDLWQHKPSTPLARPTRRSRDRADLVDLEGASSLAEAHAEAEHLAAQAHTAGTKRAYQVKWDAFAQWWAAQELVRYLLPSTRSATTSPNSSWQGIAARPSSQEDRHRPGARARRPSFPVLRRNEPAAPTATRGGRVHKTTHVDGCVRSDSRSTRH